MSLIQLSAEDRRSLADWLGMPNVKMSLIYSADRDGCSPEAFHKKCNNRSPVLVVASTTDGYIFGGYAPVPWVATNHTYLPAPEAFLFRLRKSNAPDYQKFEALDDSTAIQSLNDSGPFFGTSDNGIAALSFFDAAIQKENDMFICPNLSVDLAEGFKNNGLDNNALHGGNNKLINIEVYTVEESMLREERWRGLDFTEASLASLKEEIIRFEPPKQLAIPKANILLVGQVGAGKSSFFNTLSSAFQGRVTVKATTGSASKSITTKFRQYGLHEYGSRQGGQKLKQQLKLRLCDTMGLEDNGGLVISDVPYILDGNIKTNFQFNPTCPVSAQHPDFQTLPKPKDCMHVVAIVIDCSTVPSMSSALCEKYRTIIQHANLRSIPVAVVLSKVDAVCEVTARDLSKVFLSTRIEESVNAVAEKLGIARSCILPVKNYEQEVAVVRAVDVLALHTLVRLLSMAEDRLDDLLEQRGYYDDNEAPGPVGGGANTDRAGAGDRK